MMFSRLNTSRRGIGVHLLLLSFISGQSTFCFSVIGTRLKVMDCTYFVYLLLESTWYRNRSRNYFPQWSEYEWSDPLVPPIPPEKKKRNGKQQGLVCGAGFCRQRLDSDLFSPILLLHSSFSLILPGSCWWAISERALQLDSMVFAATCWSLMCRWKMHARSQFPLMLKAHDKTLYLSIRLTRENWNSICTAAAASHHLESHTFPSILQLFWEVCSMVSVKAI